MVHRALVNHLLKYYIQYVFRGKKVYLVSGMRRSGNHVFISWFANALNEAACQLDYSRNHFVGLIEGGRVIHLNEINVLGLLGGLKLVQTFAENFREADFIILSQEDCDPDYSNYLNSRVDHHIFVDRDTLNLIASRIKGMISWAEKGIGWTNYNVDRAFLERIARWRACQDVLRWEYDRWQECEDYRKEFLQKFGLSFDLMPSVTKHGGGSSFSKNEQTPTETTSRYRQIPWSKKLLDLLGESEFQSLLKDEEREFLSEVAAER